MEKVSGKVSHHIFDTLYLVFYLESSDVPRLSDIPVACREDFDIRELLWLRIFCRPHCLAPHDQGEYVVGTLPLLADFDTGPLFDNRYFLIQKL